MASPLAWNLDTLTLAGAESPDVRPALVGDYQLPDGCKAAVPAFQLFA